MDKIMDKVVNGVINEDEAILAQAADASRLPPGCASVRSIVSYEELASRTRRAVTLVAPEHADAAAGMVSVLSPVGRALLGRRAGDRVEAQLPDGRALELKIASVGR